MLSNVVVALPGAVETLLPTPNPFHMGNNEQPDEWRRRLADVKARTNTQHGPALSVVALSITEGRPLVPSNYYPDDENVELDDDVDDLP